jgi:hypothetical protein
MVPIEGSVPGLPVEVARQAIEAEQRRRRRSLLRWLAIGAALVVAGLLLGLPPSAEEVDRGAEATTGEIAGVVCLVVGVIAIGTALLVEVAFVTRARSVLGSPLGEGEVRMWTTRRNARAEVRGPSGGSRTGVASCRAQGWRDGAVRHPAQLFGSPDEGGYVAAVVWLPDGSTRVIGVNHLRAAE